MNNSISDQESNKTNLRRQGIGGHDIAAICGVHPFMTALDVYEAKVNGVDKFNPNYIQARGLALESTLIHFYLLDNFQEILNPDETDTDPEFFIVRDERFTHKEFSYMHAHPDAVIKTYGGKPFRGVECKAPTIAKVNQWGDEGTNQIPEYIRTQTQWYCEILDVEQFDIPIDTPFGMRVYHWNRDYEFGEQLIAEAKNFWVNHVLAKIPPAAQTLDDLKILYPKSNGKNIDSNVDIMSKHMMLKEVKHNKKILEDEEEALKFDIANFYGENEIAFFEGQKISSYSTSVVNRTDESKLKSDFPAAYAGTRKQTSHRTLRLYIK